MTEWLTVQQVAKHLQLSPAKIYQLARSGGIPASKVGKQWRFDQARVDRWLSQLTQSENGPDANEDG